MVNSLDLQSRIYLNFYNLFFGREGGGGGTLEESSPIPTTKKRRPTMTSVEDWITHLGGRGDIPFYRLSIYLSVVV